MPNQPTAVLLDVGGVFLLPSRDHIRKALAQIVHTVPNDLLIDRAHFVAVREFPLDLDPGAWMGPLWVAYLIAYAGAVGVEGTRVHEAVEHLRNAYATGRLWSQVIEGSEAGLAELVDTGVPVGIVSNSDGTIEQRLGDLGVLQVGPGRGVEVRCVVDSGVVEVEKPDPHIFEPALEALEVDADGVWYVGDSPAFDVTGARRAGLTPILMDPFGVNGDYGVATARSLSEVAATVRS